MLIYVVNESQEAGLQVFFDDLEVTLTTSEVVSATDYYPFGSPMKNSYAREDYRFGFQGQFAEKDQETGWNSFELRMYDAVIGRWLVPDPFRQYWSPYVAFGNNPINRVDPDGGMDDNPRPGEINFETNQVYGLNATTGEYEWYDILNGLTITPDFSFFSFLGDFFLKFESGGGGFEFLSTGPSGPAVYDIRDGNSSGIIVDPASGLVVFKELFRGFPRGHIPLKNKTIKVISDFISGFNSLFQIGGNIGDGLMLIHQMIKSDISSYHGGLNTEESDFVPDTISIGSPRFKQLDGKTGAPLWYRPSKIILRPGDTSDVNLYGR